MKKNRLDRRRTVAASSGTQISLGLLDRQFCTALIRKRPFIVSFVTHVTPFHDRSLFIIQTYLQSTSPLFKPSANELPGGSSHSPHPTGSSTTSSIQFLASNSTLLSYFASSWKVTILSVALSVCDIEEDNLNNVKFR